MAFHPLSYHCHRCTIEQIQRVLSLSVDNSSFSQTTLISQLGRVLHTLNTEKLCLLQGRKKSVKVFSAIHVYGHGLAASPI